MNRLFLLAALTLAFAEPIGHDRCQLIDSRSVPLADVCPETNSIMSYLSLGGFVANDGIVHGSCKKGLVLDSNPFSLWVGPGPVPELDHTKLVLLSNDAYAIPQNGKLVLSGSVKVNVLKNQVCKSPYPDCVAQEEDLRFGSGAFTALDFSTGLNFGFLITNDRIYALYERLALLRPALGNYAAFAYVVPVASRKRNKFSEVAIVLDSTIGTVSYKVEKCHKLTVGNIGARPENRELLLADLGGDDVSLFPAQVQLFIGTLTDLDFYPACKDLENCEYPCARMALTTAANETAFPRYNPLLGPDYLCQYFDQVGTTREAHIWGQGVVETFKWIKINTYAC